VNGDDGRIHLDLLAARYSPAWDLRILVEHIRALLGRANSTVNPDSAASRMLARDPAEYLSYARMFSQQHADAPNDANWNWFPTPRNRIPIERIIIRTWGGTTRAFAVTDATTVAEVKDILYDSQGIPSDQLTIIGRGLLMSDEKTLQYYGLESEATLTMGGASSTEKCVDLLSFVYGPDAPQIVATLEQATGDDGGVCVLASLLDGTELVRVSTTPDQVFTTVYDAIVEKMPSAHGRLRLLTSDGIQRPC